MLNRLLRSFLWHSGIGRRTAEQYWRLRTDGNGLNMLYERTEKVFDELPTAFANAAYSKFIAVDSARWSKQPEFVLRADDVLLEPERLLGTRGTRDVVAQTIVFRHDRQYPFIVPQLLGSGRAKTLPAAILYDGSATRNYYHHFVDALSRLGMLARPEVPADLPLLVNRFVFEQPFFQLLYKRNAEFRALNWRIVEDGEWLRVKQLYVVQALHFSGQTWRGLRALYQLPPARPHRRIFLNRDRTRFSRYLDNEDEVLAMLTRYGFENVYAEHLTIDEQLQLFQETEYLVALTGMGLIQQLFMNPAYGHIIEIMPANRLMPEYYWQAYALGMRYYDVVVGDNMAPNKGYPVSLQQVEAAVQRMLANEHPGRVYGLTSLPALPETTTAHSA